MRSAAAAPAPTDTGPAAASTAEPAADSARVPEAAVTSASLPVRLTPAGEASATPWLP